MTASEDRPEQYERLFAENGYLIFRDVVPKAPLSELAAKISSEYERQRHSGALFAGGGNLAGHLNCFPGEASRFVYEALEKRGIIEVVKRLSPHSLGRLRVSCNLNLPKSVAQHYHMDGIFIEDFMIVNIAVIDTDLVNGAIDVIPGTHKKFYKFWKFAVGRTHRGSTRLPLKQGDVLIRTSKLWHRGMPNKSNNPRPMLAFTFGEKAAVDNDAFQGEHDGKIAFDWNWFRPTRIGRIRERTFVSVPLSYSAYRFVTSLFNNKGYAD